jgi:sulfur carrier protein ThiS
LKLSGGLADQLPGGVAVVEVDDGTTLEELLAKHGLDARYYVVVLNNAVSPSRSTLLSDGDRVIVHPQMAGG